MMGAAVPVSIYFKNFDLCLVAAMVIGAGERNQLAGPAHRNALITYQFFC